MTRIQDPTAISPSALRLMQLALADGTVDKQKNITPRQVIVDQFRADTDPTANRQSQLWNLLIEEARKGNLHPVTQDSETFWQFDTFPLEICNYGELYKIAVKAKRQNSVRDKAIVLHDQPETPIYFDEIPDMIIGYFGSRDSKAIHISDNRNPRLGRSTNIEPNGADVVYFAFAYGNRVVVVDEEGNALSPQPEFYEIPKSTYKIQADGTLVPFEEEPTQVVTPAIEEGSEYDLLQKAGIPDAMISAFDDGILSATELETMNVPEKIIGYLADHQISDAEIQDWDAEYQKLMSGHK